MIINEEVEKIFNTYPDSVSIKLMNLRSLIIETVKKLNLESSFEETIKWGQASYKVKDGSTIRLAWSNKTPGIYGMYFTCSTRLIETFRELYNNHFTFEDNRAILFEIDEVVYEQGLVHCIELALTYHKIKDLPNLGI